MESLLWLLVAIPLLALLVWLAMATRPTAAELRVRDWDYSSCEVHTPQPEALAALEPQAGGDYEERDSLPVAAAGGANLVTDRDARTYAMLAQLLGLFTAFFGPLVIWVLTRSRHRFVDYHGRESLNLHLTMLVIIGGLTVLGFVLQSSTIGMLLPLVLMVGVWYSLVTIIVGAVKANMGQWYRHPVRIEFLRLPSPLPESEGTSRHEGRNI